MQIRAEASKFPVLYAVTRETADRDGFARDCFLQRRVSCEPDFSKSGDVAPMRQLSPVSEPISPAKFAHFVLRTGQFEKIRSTTSRPAET
jgi:hypothetical protein